MALKEYRTRFREFFVGTSKSTGIPQTPTPLFGRGMLEGQIFTAMLEILAPAVVK
jgi:hypothetical protein